MTRKISNITLVLLLGIYYNSVPIAWLAYSTFAEKVFAERCINPGKSSCQGKCQVMAMQSKAEKSPSPGSTPVRLPQYHPPLPAAIFPDKMSDEKRVNYYSYSEPVASGILPLPFHPPKSA